MVEEPEAGVLQRFVRGDPDAMEVLVRTFQADVYRWIRRIVRDPATAEDLAIESFWRAYRGRARFDPARSFGAWMRRIATNVARDHLGSVQARMRWLPIAVDVAAPARSDPGLAESVALAMGRLPTKLHIVAVLALVEDRPYDEIADALGVPVGTVKSRVFRAVRMLRKELARLGVQP